MSLPTPTILWFHNVPGRGGGGDRREDGESGPWVRERVLGSQGRARGDRVCRLCPRCRQAHQLAAGLPAAFLLVAKLWLNCVLSSSCKTHPKQGLHRSAGAVQSWGYPRADTSKNQQEKTSARPGAVARRPHLSPHRARWVPSHAGGGVPEGGRGVGGRQGSTVWVLAWWGW